jgi:DNA polymerase III epsilon subunit-like protein
MGVLKKCLRDYEIDWKSEVPYCCTVQMGRRLLPGIRHGLDDMCSYYRIDLDHHKADSDARAAAEIMLRYMEAGAEIESFVKQYKLKDEPGPDALICPRCGKELILRTARKGFNAGNRFYGCSGYPKCRYVKNL